MINGTPERPVSVEQAKARVVLQLDHLELACRDSADIGHAARCLDEALDEFWTTLIGSAA